MDIKDMRIALSYMVKNFYDDNTINTIADSIGGATGRVGYVAARFKCPKAKTKKDCQRQFN